jgi:hypothetical protein
MQQCRSALPQAARPLGIRGEADLSTPDFRIYRIKGQRRRSASGSPAGARTLDEPLGDSSRQGRAPTRTSKFRCLFAWEAWTIGPGSCAVRIRIWKGENLRRHELRLKPNTEMVGFRFCGTAIGSCFCKTEILDHRTNRTELSV